MPLKTITRFFALAPIFILPFFTLIVANSYFFPFITGKAFFFRILVEIAFLAWIVLASLDVKYRPKWNALTVAVTVFAVVALVADLLGVNPIRSIWSNFERMEGWVTISHLWMLFMVMVNTFGTGEAGKKMWQNWMNVSLVSAGIVAIYGLSQFFGLTGIHQSASRVDATLGNAAYMAVYMLISAGFAVYLLLESKTKRTKIIARAAHDKGSKLVSDILSAVNLSALEWLYAVIAIIFSFLLIETSTRGTMLGLVGGIVVALVAYSVFGKGASKLSRQISGGIVLLLIVLGGLFITFKNSPVIQKYEPLQRLASISLSNTESVSRLYIWGMALTGFEQRPVLGWGQENFNYVFNANYNPKMYGQEQWFDRAHSVYVDWAINGGIVGLLAYLALYVFFLLAVWKSTLSTAEKSVLTGLLAGYAVHNIFVFDNLASYVFFFAMLAFAASLSRAEKKSPKVEANEKHTTGLKAEVAKIKKEINSEVAEYIIAPLAIIALIAGLYFINIRVMNENTLLIAALQSCGGNTLPDVASFEKVFATGAYVGDQEAREQLLSCTANVVNSQQVPNPTKQAFFGLTVSEIQNQIATTPKDARIYTLAGSFMEQISQFDQAVKYLETAHSLSPTKQTTSMSLGTAYINSGKFDKAIEVLKAAYEEETSFADAKSAYITALIAGGHDADAQKLFGSDQGLFKTEQIAQAYTLAKQYDKAIAIYQGIIGTSTDNVNAQFRLASIQYAAGRISQAVATLKAIEENNPQYKTQIEAAIKQVQSGK